MTSVFQARRRAEEFAAAVDGVAESSATRDREITTLLGLVGAMRDQQLLEPRADFVSDLRGRLMLEAETALKPETPTLALPVRQRGRRERRLVAAASAFVLIGGTTTMAAAAQSALPGEALYPIKRGIEQAEAGLSTSAAGKGENLLAQASHRLTEVRGLVESDSLGSVPQVPATLAAFSSSATEGSELMFASFRETADPESIVAVRSFTSQGIATLEALAPAVPAEAQDELAAAAILLHEIDSEAAALCGTCAADLPVVEVPGIFLARAEVDRAMQLAKDKVLLNNHPVVVSNDLVKRAGQAATTPTPTPSGSPSGPAEPTPGSLPSPSLNPSTWEGLLPGVEEDAKSGSSSGGTGDAGDLDGSLEDSLKGIVKTLLPDPDGTLG
jgi:Domain of unknown function (DUF5667)